MVEEAPTGAREELADYGKFREAHGALLAMARLGGSVLTLLDVGAVGKVPEARA